MSRAPKRRVFGRVFVHAALPGTASGIAQARMAELAAAGRLRVAAYPAHAGFDGATAQPGNADALAKLLLQPVDESLLEEQLRHALALLLDGERSGPERNLLLSSELFFFAAPASARVLRRVLSDVATEATQLVFVRPLRDWTHSIHAQMVVGHGLDSDYGLAWLDDYFVSFADRFRDLVGWDMETVALPDVRSGLLRGVLEAIGEDPRLADEVADERECRGLLDEELALARMVNARFHDPHVTTAVTAALRTRWPDDAPGQPSAQAAAAFASFAESFTARIAGIPGDGMARIRALLLLPDPGPVAAGPLPMAPARLMEAFSLVLDVLAREGVEQARAATRFKTLSAYAAQRLEPSHAFFDPIHYLLQHDDLLAANVDPWAHYFDHGRPEGRPSALARKDLK